MPMPASWQQHRTRWIVAAIGIVVLGVLVALAVHVHALLQPQRFTHVLERDLGAVGIKLQLEAPASPQLLPRPGVKLQGFSLSNRGATTPILQASGATIVVPWRALLHGDIAIERVEIDAPRIDLGELGALLERLPHHRGPPQLPTIVTGIHLNQGTLTNHGEPLLFEVSADTGELVPGRAFRLDATARDASGHPLSASLSTVPSPPHDGAIDFTKTHLSIRKHDGLALQLAGEGHWRGGEDLALQLTGSLTHHSFNPPPTRTAAAVSSAPAQKPIAATTVVDQVKLTVTPARNHTPLTVAIQLAGADTQADFSVQPTEFGRWWKRVLAASPDHPPGLLPFTGSASIQHIDVGGFKATGLKIDADADLAPAASTSSAPVASAAH
ncbi:MAG TPA: AsmA family protein [Rhodanobacteraceae bacterium]